MGTGPNNATNFAKDLLDSERASDLRLVEIDSSTIDGEPTWLVTLSNPFKKSDVNSIATAIGANSSREYRVFTVRKSDAEILSMKTRLFALAQWRQTRPISSRSAKAAVHSWTPTFSSS